MEPFGEFSLEVTKWLQENYSQLDPLFETVSSFVRFEVYLAIIPLIYWSLEKRLGRSLAYLVTFSNMINEILKAAFRDPRPYWTEEGIGLDDEKTYGVPSGHAQTATVLYLYLAAWFKKRWIWVVALTLVFLTCLSRLYLGVHDIEDILAGVLVGVIILVAFYLWTRFASASFTNRILGQRLLIAIAIPFTLGAIYLAVLFTLGEPNYGVLWETRIDIAERIARSNVARAFGGLIGLSVGFLLEGSRVRFLVDGPVWKRALRYLVGISVTILLWAGLSAVLPDEPEWLDIVLTIVRYLLVSLWIAYYAPMTFIYLRLADASPVPESSIKF
ncbi:MAG: phosphatase PAP2 family protein [Candidatus Promineifilaceae bacterium]